MIVMAMMISVPLFSTDTWIYPESAASHGIGLIYKTYKNSEESRRIALTTQIFKDYVEFSRKD